MVRFCRHAFARAPGQVVLDIDDTFDAVHGRQQLRLFNAFYDEYGSSPLLSSTESVVFGGAVVRPVRRPKAGESAAHIRRFIRQIRKHRPKTEILLRADSPCCTPQGPDPCDRLGLRHVFGLAQNSRRSQNSRPAENSCLAQNSCPAGNSLPPEASSAAQCARNHGQKLRHFKTFSCAARSWSEPRPCRSTRSDTPGPTRSV
jgi:hypothetical protein